jgi:hypothetical protein
MSIILDHLNRVRLMLSNCKPLQRWLGIDPDAPDAAQMAANKIYLEGISSGTGEELTQAEQQNIRPYVLVVMPTGTAMTWDKRGAPNCWRGSGEIGIILSKQCDDTTIADIFAKTADEVGKIISNEVSGEPGLMELADQATYLNVNKIDVEFQGRTPQEEIVNYGDAYDVLVMLSYS